MSIRLGRLDPERILGAIFVFAVVIFLFAPAVIMVLFAFEASERWTFPMTGLSLRWFEKAITGEGFGVALRNSLLVAVVSGLLAGTIGTAAAFGLQHFRPSRRQIAGLVVMLPATVPGLMLGIGMIVLLRSVGGEPGLVMIILAHTILGVPFVISTVGAQLDRFDFTLLEAARDLGASSIRAGRDVIFPLVRAAIVGSFFLSAALSVEEFVVTFFVKGDETTVPILIWGLMRLGVDSTINALAALVLFATVGLAIIANRVTRVEL
jgi:spermidine/putrescine transport system permease protein